MVDRAYFNLIHDQWIPVKRRSGKRLSISPAQIVDQLESDPVVSFEWPRPDFQIACHEFMIGLLATAFPPANKDEWKRLWRNPPTVAQLNEAFSKLKDAFYLNGPGACFLQDFSELDTPMLRVEQLLIEAPGDNTLKKNTDLFNHRNQVEKMTLPEAAMALYTLQSWAPGDGGGHREGLRGGGPMVTFVLPCRSDPSTLWDILWANTPYGDIVTQSDMSKVFPWLAPTITSEGDYKIGPEDDKVDKRQCWWSMPWRVRLHFSSKNKEGDVVVDGWRRHIHGPKYIGWVGESLSIEGNVVIHPLTPRSQVKGRLDWLPFCSDGSGLSYKHWLGRVCEEENRRPASSVSIWRNERIFVANLNDKQDVRLLAAGYVMKKRAALAFLENEMPLPGSGDSEVQKQCDEWAGRAVKAANLVTDCLKKKLNKALKEELGKSVKGDKQKNNLKKKNINFPVVDKKFTELTEKAFFALLDGLLSSGDQKEEDFTEEWLRSIKKAALSVFDSIAPLTLEAKLERAGKIVSAKRELLVYLNGYKLKECLQLPS